MRCAEMGSNFLFFCRNIALLSTENEEEQKLMEWKLKQILSRADIRYQVVNTNECPMSAPATLVGKFRYSRDWWPVPHIVVVVAWWPTLSSPSKSCTLSEHLTPDSINLGGDLAAHINSSL